jgi:PKD domain
MLSHLSFFYSSRKDTQRRITRVLTSAVILGSTLVACGSGSSSVGAGNQGASPIQNIAPVANAGSAQDLIAGTVVTLDASRSSDMNGDSLSYIWTLNRPAGSTAALSNASSPSATFVPDRTGLYTATLVVNDGKLNSMPAMVTVTAKSVLAFDSLTPLPPNIVSGGFQATALNSLGDRVALQAGSPRTLDSITIAMSSWACETGAWNAACASTVGSSFNHPLTLKIFSSTGAELSSVTQAFTIPFRPSADPTCVGADVGKWKGSDGICYNGFATKITFDLTASRVTLPSDDFSYVLSYNTNTQGPAPIGSSGPYDSLNVGFYPSTTAPSIGTDPDPGFLNRNGISTNGGNGIRAQVEVIRP